MGNRSWRRSAQRMDLQGRQAHRQQERFRGRPAARQVDFRCPEARSAMRRWWICVSMAVVLAAPILGTAWPVIAVAGGWLMTNRFVRRR